MELKSNDLFLKGILVTIAIGIWAQVFQNAGLLLGSKTVAISNEVKVAGRVEVGRIYEPIDIAPNQTIKVDITKINGWDAANYKRYDIDGKEYHALGTGGFE